MQKTLGEAKALPHWRAASRVRKSKRYIQRFPILGFSFVFFTLTSTAQEFLPSPPADRALIYVLDDQDRLGPLPFEQGQTPLHSDEVAKGTKVSYIELKGEHSATTLTTAPRLFLFTSERPGTHPPFLVWLTPHSGARRVTAIAQKGMQGFAVDSEAIIKPTIRVLARLDGDQVFVELRPRSSLIAGEYAIIGDDLTRIATFRIVAGATR